MSEQVKERETERLSEGERKNERVSEHVRESEKACVSRREKGRQPHLPSSIVDKSVQDD